MLRKAVAALLLFLAASPFTAPFETCDVGTLFGGHTPAIQSQLQMSPAVAADQSEAVALSSRRIRSRTKSASPIAAVLAARAIQPMRAGACDEGQRFFAPTPVHSPQTPLRV
jgi:hypothetical protein